MPTPRDRFLARVDELVPGWGARFAPPLDALVVWSLSHDLEYVPVPAALPVVRFRLPGADSPLWAAVPHARSGAVLVLMDGPGFDAAARCQARVELAGWEGRPVDLARPPELTFGKLDGAACRAAVLALLERQLGPPAPVRRRAAAKPAESAGPPQPARV